MTTTEREQEYQRKLATLKLRPPLAPTELSAAELSQKSERDRRFERNARAAGLSVQSMEASQRERTVAANLAALDRGPLTRDLEATQTDAGHRKAVALGMARSSLALAANSMGFQEWITSMGFVLSDLNEKQASSLLKYWNDYKQPSTQAGDKPGGSPYDSAAESDMDDDAEAWEEDETEDDTEADDNQEDGDDGDADTDAEEEQDEDDDDDRVGARGQSVEIRGSGIDAGLTIRAAEGSDAGAVPKFSMVAYNGGPMNLDGHDYPVIVDLASCVTVSEQTPILYEHDPEREVGHAPEVEIDAQGIRVPIGYFSGASPERDRVVKAAQRKYPWQASIGGRAEYVEIIGEEETASVNGQQFTGPVEVAYGVRLREISILSLGADAGTSAVLAARAGSAPDESELDQFDEYVRSTLLMNPSELTDLQRRRVYEELFLPRLEREQE